MVLTKYIVLEKKNEVYLTIDAEDGIRRDIGEYFTFEVPGFKFMPQYRNRVCDGKIRLYNYASKTIYAGCNIFASGIISKSGVTIAAFKL